MDEFVEHVGSTPGGASQRRQLADAAWKESWRSLDTREEKGNDPQKIRSFVSTPKQW